MNTLICPTCGCSLVRLGISQDKATRLDYIGEPYYFCCEGCADLFGTDPQAYLQESNNLIVCPTCLAEKPRQQAVRVEVGGQHVYFCRCPYCAELFRRDPDYYGKRLEGVIPNAGVLDHEGCCIRPE